MPQITVFGSRLSPFVEKVARGLQLKKIEYELVPPQGFGDLRRWSPQTGKMPVADINGERIYDSTLILRRINELFPEPPLLSRDPEIAAAQRQLEDWADESLYWYVMALRWTRKNARATVGQITEGAPALRRALLGVMLRRFLGSKPRAQGLGRLPDAVVVRELSGRLDDLIIQLGGRPFFFSDQPSIADLAVYGMLHAGISGPTPEVNRLVGERPPLGDWMRRLEQATGD